VTFLWPVALLLYLLIPGLIAAYVWMIRRPSRVRVRYSSLDLVARAAAVGQPWRRHVPAALYLLSLCAVIFTVARPMAPIPVPDDRTVIMLSIDVSRSMMAHDVVPTRIDAAKKAAVDTRAHGLAVEKEALAALTEKGVSVVECDREAFRKRVAPQTDNFMKARPEAKPVIELIRATQI